MNRVLKSIVKVMFALTVFVTPLAANAQVETVDASNKIVQKALSRVGKRYRTGGGHSMAHLKNKNQSYFDCSGFVNWVYYQAGQSIGVRTTQSLKSVGKRVSWNNLKAGDIVLFGRYPGSKHVTHATIYIGNGTLVHAGTSRTGVAKSKLNQTYWRKRFIMGRRK